VVAHPAANLEHRGTLGEPGGMQELVDVPADVGSRPGNHRPGHASLEIAPLRQVVPLDCLVFHRRTVAASARRATCQRIRIVYDEARARPRSTGTVATDLAARATNTTT